MRDVTQPKSNYCWKIKFNRLLRFVDKFKQLTKFFSQIIETEIYLNNNHTMHNIKLEQNMNILFMILNGKLSRQMNGYKKIGQLQQIT